MRNDIVSVDAIKHDAAIAMREHPVWLGGAAAMMSVCITHPIDQTKIRSQTQIVRLGMTATARQTVRSSGFFGLWHGLSGSLLRQATYGTARFGVYAKLKEIDGRSKNAEKNSRWKLVKNGAIAGLVAGAVGAPGDLVMVRMSADGIKSPEQRLNYPSALHGIYRIARDEGLSKVFRGFGATCLRNVILNASQLPCYDVVKARLLRTGYIDDGIPLHLLTSAIGGTISVTLCAPVDVMKSRIQSSTLEGVVNIVKRSLRAEGVSVLFRGWLPAWYRMMPSTMLTFAFLEQLRKVF
ncbi:hypothetical protein CI109_102018 [Kwoniella shandongensis]|uniref:Mitochondrial dicarboxylate transporter n=1 Tax=Kwoniella shandongensis TaxID=1734106 RepID=A0AAJ8MW56_9TREE